MVNICPLTAEIGSGVWGTPANFNGFRVLASLLQQRRLTKVNQTLHDVWPSPGQLLGAVAPNGILLGEKSLFVPSLALCCIGSVTARYSSSRRQPNFVAWYKESNYGNFTEGATCIRLGGHFSCFVI